VESQPAGGISNGGSKGNPRRCGEGGLLGEVTFVYQHKGGPKVSPWSE